MERILRAEEERAIEVLTRHRGGLDAVANALLVQETLDGREVGRLIDEAYGRPVHAEGAKAVPQFNGHGATNGNGKAATNGSEPVVANGAPVPVAGSGTGDEPAAEAPEPGVGSTAPWPPPQAPAGGWPPPQMPPPKS